MTEHVNGAELLARIKPQVREQATNICLRPDLLDAWAKAETELAELQDQAAAPNARMASVKKADLTAAAEKVRALEAEIEDTQVRFVFQAMPSHEWATLTEQNPPRSDNQVDQYVGYDRHAVTEQAIRRCMVSPTFEDCTKAGCDHTDCGTWQMLQRVCNPSEWAELRNTADEVNGAAVTATPKSDRASQILDRPARTSPRRASGE